MDEGSLLGQISRTLLSAPLPTTRDYEAYLAGFDVLGHGFGFRELVRTTARRNREMPPTRMWPAMVLTLALANVLRTRMMAHGARGLVIAAAYRPNGGASDSRHKHNAAIDLDLMTDDQDRGLAWKFAREAALLWREHEEIKVGLGTYAPDEKLWSNRIHIDTGWRHRCWQGIRTQNGTAVFSKHPAALVLAPHDESDLLSTELVAGPEAQRGAVS